MSSRLVGMDTEHAREVSSRMGQHAGQVAGVCEKLLARVAATAWVGPDKDHVEADLGQQFLPQARTAAESIQEQARALTRYAERQDVASC